MISSQRSINVITKNNCEKVINNIRRQSLLGLLCYYFTKTTTSKTILLLNNLEQGKNKYWLETSVFALLLKKSADRRNSVFALLFKSLLTEL